MITIMKRIDDACDATTVLLFADKNRPWQNHKLKRNPKTKLSTDQDKTEGTQAGYAGKT